jgi:hypothetical protein
LTTTYKGEVIYVGQGISTGMNFYACGATNAPANEKHPREMGFISPVFKHLDLIKQAEEFIAQQAGPKKSTASKTASSITCVKGKVSKKVSGPNAKCPKGYKKK